MFFANFFRMDLRRLILLLAIFSALVTLANGFYASYRVQRQQLIDSALESNHVYARKLAESVEDFLQAAQQQLAYSAGVLGARFDPVRGKPCRSGQGQERGRQSRPGGLDWF